MGYSKKDLKKFNVEVIVSDGGLLTPQFKKWSLFDLTKQTKGYRALTFCLDGSTFSVLTSKPLRLHEPEEGEESIVIRHNATEILGYLWPDTDYVLVAASQDDLLPIATLIQFFGLIDGADLSPKRTSLRTLYPELKALKN